MNRCSVAFCPYVADAFINLYPVCNLHHDWRTEKILLAGNRPGHFWYLGRPLVMPCGELDDGDFLVEPAHEGAIHCWEDQELADVQTDATKAIYADFDLTQE
jgi:hypothetical protein